MAAGTDACLVGTCSDRESVARAALESADLGVLRVVMYQLTCDPAIAAMPMQVKQIKGGAQLIREVAAEDAVALRELALRYLLDPPAPIPEPPVRDKAYDLLAFYEGGALSDSEKRFSYDELSFEDFPRDVRWTSSPDKQRLEDFHVVIVGAGVSGIAAGVYLGRLGIRYTIVERQADLGGVWQVNRYPEARVDTSSFLYQFKFEKNYPWEDLYAPQPETLRYLRHIAEKYEVLPHCRFGRQVSDAAWDEASATWKICCVDADGVEERLDANVIISASGLFSTPQTPDIPGVESFEGKMFHTTQWDYGYSCDGKRIALIGTGSTGTQLMPRIAEGAEQMTVFQRHPHWIVQTEAYRQPVDEGMRWLFANLPYYWNWYCYSRYAATRAYQDLQEHDPAWTQQGGLISEKNDAFRENLLSYISSKIGDRPDLMEKCVPTFAPLSKRLVVDNGWYDALRRENVELVTNGIAAFTPTGIVTKDGTEREFDLVILASGFKVSQYLFPVNYRGRDGITLDDLWKADGARAYLGAAMPGFPNFFMLYGPNSQPRNGGFHSWAEIWARYVTGGIVAMIEADARSVEVKRSAFEEHNEEIDQAAEKLTWMSEGRHSYYVNEHGRSGVNSPLRTDKYFELMERFDPAAYTLS